MEILQVPRGAVPWIAPTGLVAGQALRQLDRPLLAWRTEQRFDPAQCYDDNPAGSLTTPEREVRALGARAEWRMERIWLPDGEESEQDREAYESGCREICGRFLHPQCLDAYAELAYSLAGDPEDNPGQASSDEEREAITHGLEWAAAGVCVLQQSLPWPFTECLPYGEIDNRPAHRVLFAYAALLYRLHPRKAMAWFRALVYLSPLDNLGARLYFAAPKTSVGN
ncbi:hypothetical protein [Nocardia altamirensis]|uniref:hypothetical protein n=1 Tax=Nocardia altamirensis TaxID=472158 RepID=UPI0008403713|nr:hypothetical protein [Nocardia altamirensis]